MSNRKKLVRTKAPISVAAIKAENERRAKLEGEDKLEQLASDRRSRRALRRRIPVISLFHRHGDDA